MNDKDASDSDLSRYCDDTSQNATSDQVQSGFD